MTLEDVRNVTVLGTGMMGPGIALLFAKAGYKTTMWGPDEQDIKSGEENLQRNIDDLLNQDILTRQEADQFKQNIIMSYDLETAVSNADFVSEAIPEILDLKQNIFAEMEQYAQQHAVLTSNTSGLMPSAISAKMAKNENMLVAHFWNPAHLVPLVEVCGHPETSQTAVDLTMDILKSIDKEPVLLRKEILGFLGNRVMHAMNREALALVSEGVCSPEDIDKVVLSSFGPRFANLGLLEYLDFCGLEHIQRIQQYLYGDLDNTPGALPVINQKVKDGDLGCETGKGLFDWSQRDKDGPRIRRDQEFVRRLKEQKKKS